MPSLTPSSGELKNSHRSEIVLKTKNSFIQRMKNPPNNNSLELYFGDARSKLIDLAAFMDRIERNEQTEDYRYQAFIQALSHLQAPSNRVEAVLKSFSDPTEAPILKAGSGPATGAWKK